MLDHTDHLGHVSGSLEPVEARADSVNGTELRFARIADGKMCIALKESYQILDESVDVMIANEIAAAKQLNLVFGAHDALDTSAAAAFPPAHGTVEAQLLKQDVDTDTHTRHLSGDTVSSSSLDTTIEVCGPAPAITPTTHYLTVVSFHSGERPQLFVWKIDGPVTPPQAPAPAPADPDSPPQ